MIALLLAAREAYTYVPFVKPLPPGWTHWYLMLLPLCLGIAIVYKSMRCQSMRRVPREAPVLFVFIVAVMMAAAGALVTLVNYLEN